MDGEHADLLQAYCPTRKTSLQIVNKAPWETNHLLIKHYNDEGSVQDLFG